MAEIKLQWGSLPFDSINAESLGLLLAKPTETICPVNRISGAIGKCKTKKRSAVADGLNTATDKLLLEEQERFMSSQGRIKPAARLIRSTAPPTIESTTNKKTQRDVISLNIVKTLV